jgi:hypothetical protein
VDFCTIVYLVFLFFTVQNDVLVYSVSNCCCSGVLAWSIVSIDFDAEVFQHQLFGFTYFVKPNGCIRLQEL